ncbi:MAG: hypothetical protein HGA37_11555, partial [Lentimicrobium sp.]|nr:hypothetical protein [Lentimicrobium sp.]
QALLYAPFFFTAHWIAPVLGYPADGFSLPYQLILSLGGILWAIAGIFILRRILLIYFNDRISAIGLILIIAGTNFFHLAALDGTLLSHNTLFTLYALLLLLTIQWHKKPTAVRAIFIGLLCGLITLVRASEIICFIVPLLWNTGTRESLMQKTALIRKHPIQVGLAVFAMIVVGSLQLYYWKSVTGKLIFYAYDNPGEGFRFFPPYLADFLFSFRKGWLIYTPLMLAALAGFYTLYRRHREMLPAILVFFILDLWIISSWSCWWYAGGSFSARAIVPAYVLLALPLASLVNEIAGTKWRWPALAVAIILLMLNLFQSWQFKTGIIDKERMTREYYFAVFGKTSVDKAKLDELLLVERSAESTESPAHIERYTGKTIFGSEPLAYSDTTNAIRLDGNNAFAPGPDLPYNQLTDADHVWIRTSVEVFMPSGYTGKSPLLISAFHYKGKAYKYRGIPVNEGDMKPGSWQKITYWYLSPEVRTPDDNLKVYVWHRETMPVFVRNLKVEVFELKKD